MNHIFSPSLFSSLLKKLWNINLFWFLITSFLFFWKYNSGTQCKRLVGEEECRFFVLFFCVFNIIAAFLLKKKKEKKNLCLTDSIILHTIVCCFHQITKVIYIFLKFLKLISLCFEIVSIYKISCQFQLSKFLFSTLFLFSDSFKMIVHKTKIHSSQEN